MTFQTSVNTDNPLGVEGQFASNNPAANVVAPEGGFKAGSGGVTIGRFGWIQSDGVTVLNSGSGAPDGFVVRSHQGQITTYLAESSMVIPAGYEVTLMRSGDFWAKATVAGATRGQKAFAKLTDGTVQAANAGATVSGYVETNFVVGRTALVNELVNIGA